MALNTEAYVLAKGYTKRSLNGLGALKGKNCTISSIEPIEGGNRMTFSWTLDDGTVQTQTMDVLDGKDGTEGKSPEMSIERTPEDDGVVITITNSDGSTSTSTIFDGKGGGDSVEPIVEGEKLIFIEGSDATVVGEVLKM